ncbi:DUF177 domain-containing protein [Candidatus Latescibacterota bacterium]
MKIKLWGEHAREQTVPLTGALRDFDIHLDDVVFDETFQVNCTIHRDRDIARVTCRVEAPALLTCARCLEPYRTVITGEFEVVARLLKQGETPPTVPDNDDTRDETDLLFVPFGENAIDITKHVHDVLLLRVPLKPLCTESCRGLCHVCGVNLNEGVCACSEKPADDRWSALSGLLGGTE